MTSMKRILAFIMIFGLLHSATYAGFLAGNSSPYVEGKGSYAFKINSSILMVGTPFSSACLAAKYGYDDNISLSAKAGIGTIDYTTITGPRLTTDPQVAGLGIEYLLSGIKRSEYTSFITEYETVSWSIDRKSNASNEIMFGFDFGFLTSERLRTRYRLAAHNFNAGPESEDKIQTSVKYSVSTEIEYSFTKNIIGCFEVGIYFGDPVGGLITLFGMGIGFNS